MGLQFAAHGFARVDHRHAAAAARQHDGHVGAHGAAADDHGMNILGMGRQQVQKVSLV